LMDGQLNRAQEAEAQARIKTVFSRPWTTLFIQSRKNPDTVDPDTFGHRGVPIGQVEYVGRAGGRHAAVRFRTARALERHDGIQIDIPGQERPFGFPVDMLRLAAAGRGQRAQSVITAPAGALVEVELPPEYPQIPIGAPVYCSSSQAIKREFRHQRPKPRLHRIREAISVSLKITPDGITARMATGAGRVCARHFPGSFQPEKVSGKTDIAARDALGKLGDTAFRLDHIELENHEDLFVPVSFLNNMRRELVAGLEAENRQYRQNRSAKIKREIAFSVRAFDPPPTNVPRWLLKVDRLALLDGMDIDELQAAEEIIIEIGQDPLADLTAGLDRLTQQMTAARIRLALPLLTRHWEEKELVEKINALRNWKKWEAANLSAWSYLAHLAPGLDLSADWTVFALNRLAAAELINAGVTRFALSPEDGSHNMREMITAYPDQAVVIVHQDTPLFIAESCAYANLIGGCPGRPRCRFKCVTMTSRAGENLTVLERNCRTIALSRTPYCISHQLDQLKPAGARWFRADFIYRPYEPDEVRDRWRALRQGQYLPATHTAHFAAALE